MLCSRGLYLQNGSDYIPPSLIHEPIVVWMCSRMLQVWPLLYLAFGMQDCLYTVSYSCMHRADAAAFVCTIFISRERSFAVSVLCSQIPSSSPACSP